MAKITRSAFKAAKNTRYATNGIGAITGTVTRAHEEDTADSVVFIDDDISTNSDFTVDGTKLTTRAAIKTLVDASGGTPETLQRSTNEISYDQDANYGTYASPRTGALTESNTGAKLGVTALIFYDNTTLDVPATWDFHESDDLFIADDPCIIRVEYLSDTYKSASLQPITI
jgi:hypothetical protein